MVDSQQSGEQSSKVGCFDLYRGILGFLNGSFVSSSAINTIDRPISVLGAGIKLDASPDLRLSGSGASTLCGFTVGLKRHVEAGTLSISLEDLRKFSAWSRSRMRTETSSRKCLLQVWANFQ